MTEHLEILALLALAGLCLAVRWAGFLAASAGTIPPKLRRFIEAVPAPLLAALVASSAASEAGAVIAVAAAVLLMVVIRNEIIAALGGVAFAFLIV